MGPMGPHGTPMGPVEPLGPLPTAADGPELQYTVLDYPGGNPPQHLVSGLKREASFSYSGARDGRLEAALQASTVLPARADVLKRVHHHHSRRVRSPRRIRTQARSVREACAKLAS